MSQIFPTYRQTGDYRHTISCTTDMNGYHDMFGTNGNKTSIDSQNNLFGGLRPQMPGLWTEAATTITTTTSVPKWLPNERLIPTTRTPIYNPNSTVKTSSITSHSERTVIMAVTEGRGRAKHVIGLALIDLYNPVLVLSQFEDNVDYDYLRTKCTVFRPNEVIVPNSICNSDSRLVAILVDHCSQSLYKSLDRKHFNELSGLDTIRRLCCDDYKNVEIDLKDKYYCLSSCAALIKYIELNEHIIYADKSLRVMYQCSDYTMSIDSKTAKLLELIVNLNDPKSSHTLFGVLNRTKTRSGYRLLRSNILQPSTDTNVIDKRLDMIEEIISSQTMFNNLDSLLAQLTSIEMERVITQLVQTPKIKSTKSAEIKIECIIIIKHVVSLIESLIQILNTSENDVFNEFTDLLSDPRFEILMTQINKVILESCKYTKNAHSMRLEKCHAIKKGVNRLLDIARQVYSELVDDIKYISDDYSAKLSMPLKVIYTSNRGFHLQIAVKEIHKINLSLPQDFIRIESKRNVLSFTTQELISKNNRINSAVEEIFLMSDAVISELIGNIRQHIGCLYNLSEIIAKIDVIFSLAYQCSVGNWVRPTFGSYFAIKQGIHPILEKVLNTKPVANKTFICEDSNFTIITGPNMSGKSIYLKQVALLQVMAQIGSYIPAEFGCFRICDKLFSRIGNNDEIESNASTFMVEMREISHILHNCTDSSLIIIDELGRGTSVDEAIGLCWAICEQLIQTKAFTLFATHFIELTKLEDFYFNVSNYHFAVEYLTIERPNCDSYTFTHILELGVTQEVLYGLRLAHLTSLDPYILKMAQIFAQQLNEIQDQPIITGETNKENRAKYRLAIMLKTLTSYGQIPNRDTLDELKRQYYSEIQSSSQTESNDFSLI
ncbi:mutS protein homolog 4-like [Oppia nitens]|uniref:mutS protein homolog 4-like n=1 Tax=Oppia nitens TaxID=1686743 RepID=UPI0023DCCC1A|nr:mutS protein homolog 4-like [Oppia nitens]